MATTSAERQAKFRQEMTSKGFVRKNLWLSKESIEILENYIKSNDLKSIDDAVNLLIKNQGNTNV